MYLLPVFDTGATDETDEMWTLKYDGWTTLDKEVNFRICFT